MTPEVFANAKILWDYNYLAEPPRKADALFLFGHNDLRVVEYAAQVALDLNFKVIVCSGGIAHVGEVVETGWDQPEAEVFAETLIKAGVAIQRIFIENQAQNTGQNVTLSRELLRAHQIKVKSGLIIHKPFMERRALVTAQAQWPEVAWFVNSMRITFEEYLHNQPAEHILHALVGDTARFDIYAEKGFQIPQRMPVAVKRAMFRLIELGYNQHLPKLERP
ncbi:MAG TPA: YdcF family protein [Alphaproteobacteria bacterium]|nr:YdcF family protein [Alphaproteobacteria bacterium]